MKNQERKTKLSPWPYIRNNRVRSTVLIVSLALFILLIYLMDFIIGSIDEPYRVCGVDYFDRIEYVNPDIEITEQDTYETLWTKLDKNAEILKQADGVVDVKTAARQLIVFKALVGELYQECWLFADTQDCEDYMNHMGAKLVSGRMPEQPGELLLDEKYVKNNRFSGNMMSLMGNNYKIVGQVKSEYYFACGISQPAERNLWNVAFVEHPNVDIKSFGDQNGAPVVRVFDKKYGEEDLKNALGDLDIVQTLFTVVSGALLLICVTVVMSLHILDRHNEWCLLNSIGFPSGDIYIMAVKELLLCMGIAIVAGSVLTVGLTFGLNELLFKTIGFEVELWRPNAIPRIIAVLLALIGLVQIPIFAGMRRIQTIDAIES